MARTITQETYDAVVQENIEEFSMSPEEAIDDAVKQFQAQDVDLSNIIKDLIITAKSDGDVIPDCVSKLKLLQTQDTIDKDELLQVLDQLQAETDKDLPRKMLAAKEGAYDIILSLLKQSKMDKELMARIFKSMISLMTGQPDLLNPSGVDLMLELIQEEKDDAVLVVLFKWIKECCILHENNRQIIFVAIHEYLKPMLNSASAPLLRGICGVLRGLVLDDDVRVQFGKSHEHARIIAGDTLSSITDLLNKYYEDESVVHDLLLTLQAIVVRSEFCKVVEEGGGLDFLLKVFQDFSENEKINRQGFKLLKVLAGNDDCKAHIIQKGGAPLIAIALNNQKNSAPTVSVGLNCVAAITLRSPDNSKICFEAGLAEIIVECMRLHPEVMLVQKTGSWAVRNMISRSRYQTDKFLELGIEEILQNDLKKFKECEYDIKSALRDLGCKVDLKEEWTGKGGKITTQNKQ